RFLGREFLVWLWHESEVREGILPLSGGDACELWLEEQLTLVGAQPNEKSESKLKSAIPSASPEAKEALRQGKLPVKAKLRVNRGTQSWGFLLNADTLGIASVQIPALLKEENDEKFYERMDLVENLEAILDDLLGTFIGIRTSESWDAEVLPRLREWVKA
ncbi:MAG: hypothetical protein H5U40_04255, partial [Polyangiaceae bacterium]|nr:hypothetical protein [Polyangiaceae bacterium]